MAVSEQDSVQPIDEREPLLRTRGGSSSRSSSKSSPHWWKRPSVWWVIPLSAVQMAALAMTVGPMLEMLTRMACQVHRPDIGIEDARFPGWRDKLPISGPVPLPLPSMPWLMDGSPPHTPTKGELCDADTKVNQAIASLMTIDTVMVGIITVSVTGWWSARSDMWGRRPVCALASLASVLTMGGMLLVVRFGQHLPGHQYWWILPAEFISAFLGGSEGASVVYAYLSDATEPSQRASTFAMFTGVIMGAVAIGPIIGAQTIHHTGDLLSVYYVAFSFSLIVFLMWVFVVPESLSADSRAAGKRKYQEERQARAERRAAARAGAVGWSRVQATLVPPFLIELVEPLGALLPRPREDGMPGKDWGLTILSGSLLLVLVAAGNYTFLMQLARKLFGWGAEELGYWLSIVGATRAAVLLFIFPAFIYAFKPKSTAAGGDSPADVLATTRFDLFVARMSLGIDVATSLLTLTSTTSAQWITATSLTALGSGLLPSAKSLALVLALPTGTNADGRAQSETGKILGALSVLSALGAQVIGSAVFGSIYRATVGVFPRAILLASSTMMALALVAMMCIRLPSQRLVGAPA